MRLLLKRIKGKNYEKDHLFVFDYDVPYVSNCYNGNSIMAAVALAQLRCLDKDNERRREICDKYDEAFAKYLDPGKPCYVSREKITPKEAIEIILAAGGHPVLAHPMLYKMPLDRLESVIVMLKEYGLQGIEAIYSLNRPEDDAFLAKLAKRHNLYITGGSDFHGDIKPDIKLGTGKGNMRMTKAMCPMLWAKIC